MKRHYFSWFGGWLYVGDVLNSHFAVATVTPPVIPRPFHELTKVYKEVYTPLLRKALQEPSILEQARRARRKKG